MNCKLIKGLNLLVKMEWVMDKESTYFNYPSALNEQNLNVVFDKDKEDTN